MMTYIIYIKSIALIKSFEILILNFILMKRLLWWESEVGKMITNVDLRRCNFLERTMFMTKHIWMPKSNSSVTYQTVPILIHHIVKDTKTQNEMQKNVLL